MPRGQKSSEIAKIKEHMNIAYNLLNQFSDYFSKIVEDAENYHKIKPMISNLNNQLNPTPPPPIITNEPNLRTTSKPRTGKNKRSGKNNGNENTNGDTTNEENEQSENNNNTETGEIPPP